MHVYVCILCQVHQISWNWSYRYKLPYWFSNRFLTLHKNSKCLTTGPLLITNWFLLLFCFVFCCCCFLFGWFVCLFVCLFPSNVFNSSTPDTKAGKSASLVYRTHYRTARATQRNAVCVCVLCNAYYKEDPFVCKNCLWLTFLFVILILPHNDLLY